MKIFDIRNARGELTAFEVSKGLLGRRAACRIVARISGVRVVRRPRLLSWWREAVFCEFELGGVRFQVEEPFGENSRYRIGTADGGAVPELAVVRDAFAHGRVADFIAPAG